jgi:hypothetical protein
MSVFIDHCQQYVVHAPWETAATVGSLLSPLLTSIFVTVFKEEATSSAHGNKNSGVDMLTMYSWFTHVDHRQPIETSLVT